MTVRALAPQATWSRTPSVVRLGSRWPKWTPYLLAIALGLLVVGLWGYLVAHVVDGWDGAASQRREDVVAYYAAARLVQEGRGHALYDPDAVAAMERAVLGRPAGWHDGLAYMNPPFVAGLFQPLTGLAYGPAQAVWFAANALAVLGALALLLPELRRLPRRWAGVFVLGALASFPVFWSLLYGQVASLVLLCWVLFYRWLKDGREAPAGLALAAALIKPHLALVAALYLVATGRWRALAGFAAGGAVLLGVSVALAGPEATFISYPRFLLESMRWRDEYGVDRGHMFGWSAFFAQVLPGVSSWALLLIVGAASALTLLLATYVWRRYRGLHDGSRPALALAAATVLVSPHLHAQDLQILLLPAALLVAYRRDAFALAVPALLFFLVPIAVVGVNLATPALAASLAIVAAKAAGLRLEAVVPFGARRTSSPPVLRPAGALATDP